MLTGFQVEVVGYITDGGVICPDHVLDTAFDGPASDHAIIRYTAEEQWPEGLTCDECGNEIVEAADDYCTAHDAWRSATGEDDEGEFSYCENADVDQRNEPTRGCNFPDVDPNPPASRWVPCSVCGAGDGERHDPAKHGEYMALPGATS